LIARSLDSPPSFSHSAAISWTHSDRGGNAVHDESSEAGRTPGVVSALSPVTLG
jgi:hypothetical protein